MRKRSVPPICEIKYAVWAVEVGLSADSRGGWECMCAGCFLVQVHGRPISEQAGEVGMDLQVATPTLVGTFCST